MASLSVVSVRLLAALRGLQAAEGRRRLVAAFVAGALAALGQAPLYLWPLLFVAFPVLVFLMDSLRGARLSTGFAVGWAFGLGYFLAGMHWIGFPFLVDPDRDAWLLPFAIVLFPSGLALFWGGAGALAQRFWGDGPARVLVLAVSLGLFEWLRSHVLTGLPWNLIGYAWGGSVAMIQSASVWGIQGLSLVTLAAAAVPAAMLRRDGAPVRHAAVGPGLAVLVVAGLWIFGLVRVPSAPVPLARDVTLRLVQPNVPQSEKWKRDLLDRNWRRLVELTSAPGLATRSVVIWPEAAPPFPVLSTDGALEAMGLLLPDSVTLLTGTQRIEHGSERRYYNSMVAVGGSGRVEATYDKSHLVPFGEYLPLYGIMSALGITELTGRQGGFTPGPGVRTLRVGQVPAFGVLICYEIIFPGAVVEPGVRPQWLVNMTDDSWFGPWSGPYQHLGIAQVRAVEEGLPVARAANTGVSAVIDPYGRITSSLGLGAQGVVDAPLPGQIEPTIYSFAGDAIFFAMLALFACVAAAFSRPTP